MLDSFQILTTPKYASIYFPGTALLYLPGTWLHIPWWLQTVFTTAAAIGLLYLLMAELFDGLLSLLTPFLCLGVSHLRGASILLISQVPMFAMGALLFLLYVKWRKGRSLVVSALIGLVAGWAGITRPADALCVCVPIGIGMLFDLRGTPIGRVIKTIAVMLAAALPFLALQAVQNIGITGKLSEFPSDYYVEKQYPAPMLGFRSVDPRHIPQSPLIEKQVAMRDQILPSYLQHRISRSFLESRSSTTVLGTLPSALLLVLIPVSLYSLCRNPVRMSVAASLLLYLVFYTFYVFYFGHYLFVMLPATVILVLGGVETIARIAGPSGSLSRQMTYAYLLLAVGLISLASLGQLNPARADIYNGMELERAELTLQLDVTDHPAAVLFRFIDGEDIDGHRINPLLEPVYNIEDAWPLDAQVLRLHDLGEKQDSAIFSYFARTQPDRVFYRYDRANFTMTRLARRGIWPPLRAPLTARISRVHLDDPTPAVSGRKCW